MKKWNSRVFNIPIWQYSDKEIASECIDQKFNYPVSPVRDRRKNMETVGLLFTWEYIIKADEDKILHYKSEEQYIFLDKNVSIEEMLAAINESYDKSNEGFIGKINSSAASDIKITALPKPTLSPKLLIALLNK